MKRRELKRGEKSKSFYIKRTISEYIILPTILILLQCYMVPIKINYNTLICEQKWGYLHNKYEIVRNLKHGIIINIIIIIIVIIVIIVIVIIIYYYYYYYYYYYCYYYYYYLLLLLLFV